MLLTIIAGSISFLFLLVLFFIKRKKALKGFLGFLSVMCIGVASVGVIFGVKNASVKKDILSVEKISYQELQEYEKTKIADNIFCKFDNYEKLSTELKDYFDYKVEVIEYSFNSSKREETKTYILFDYVKEEDLDKCYEQIKEIYGFSEKEIENRTLTTIVK